MPPQDSLVHGVRRAALHARGDRAGGLPGGAVTLLEPPGPEPQAQVLPAVRDRAGGERPQELLHLLLELGRNSGPELRAVREPEEFEVHVIQIPRHLAYRDEAAATVSPEDELRVVVEVVGIAGSRDAHEAGVQVATQLDPQEGDVQLGRSRVVQTVGVLDDSGERRLLVRGRWPQAVVVRREGLVG